jgi:tetratricopeptide (TPR) repeat protein
MRIRKAWRPCLGLCLLSLVACTSRPKQPSAEQALKPSEDPELKLVSDMIDEIGNEIGRYRKAGGKPSDPDHPARKWSDILWQYHAVHPGTPASVKAATMALQGFVYTGQADAAIAKVGTFKPEDPAWEQVVGPFFYAASEKKDYNFFIRKVQSVLERATDKKARAALWLTLGEAYGEKKDIEHAKTAFEAAARESPDSDYTKRAKGNLYEVTSLNVGQAAPQFTAKTMEGRSLSPADLKGKVVLLNFWATW